MADPRWLVDEMLGRLSRYLRFLGMDAEYVRGWSDPEILSALAGSDRILLTRDHELARRAPRAVLLTAVGIADQLRELIAVHPELPRAPRFDRCTVCNGPLERVPGTADSGVATALPSPRYRCRLCGAVYWEGSHTARIREDLHRWLGGEGT